jgi:NAD(P)-dependent dehydrogenase (short-subunit alcohol dehydrogenase family)
MLAQEPHSSGDRGWVINISSIYGLVGQPNTTCYSSSKGAVTNMTKAAALEYATDKIHINSIHPGYAETALLEGTKQKIGNEQATAWINSMHPWGRLAWPEDVAKMAVFLAGDGASYVTGSQFVVDGGYTAR